MTTSAREVEAWLREEADAQEVSCRTPAKQMIPKLREAASALAALIAECETAKAELAEAVEVMEPFAILGNVPEVRESKVKDDAVWAGQRPAKITYGNLRAAAAFIAKHTPPQPVPVGEEKG